MACAKNRRHLLTNYLGMVKRRLLIISKSGAPALMVPFGVMIADEKQDLSSFMHAIHHILGHHFA